MSICSIASNITILGSRRLCKLISDTSVNLPGIALVAGIAAAGGDAAAQAQLQGSCVTSIASPHGDAQLFER